MRLTLSLLLAALPLNGCTYLHYASIQASYERMQAGQPSQWLAKHSLKSDTYFVYGRLVDDGWQAAASNTLAIAAFSSRYRRDEIVDINQLGQARSYYALNLPRGDYRLMVFADVNRNGTFDPDEVAGERRLSLGASAPANRVLGGFDIEMIAPRDMRAPPGFKPIVAAAAQRERVSLFFPKGTIRALDDPIFSAGMSQLGMYDPAAFMETAPMMFYALEEDLGHKVPVVFVHGIGGSPTEFRSIIESMDRTRYKPWFYFYPSGGDLQQLAHLFYDIFLSGTVIPASETPMVLIAHSMGGLVVREAMNLRERSGAGNKVALLITIATPFGGEPSARTGVERAPFVPPAWRDLDPRGEFINQLFRHPLPEGTSHHLIYTYRTTQDAAHGTDGVVPLSSQLVEGARAQAAVVSGFKSGHAEVLHNAAAIAHILDLVRGVPSALPEDQLRYLAQGGFDVPLGSAYSDLEKYAIQGHGHFLRALAAGEVRPVDPVQTRFVSVARGEAAAMTPFETAWTRFRSDYPDIAAGTKP